MYGAAEMGTVAEWSAPCVWDLRVTSETPNANRRARYYRSPLGRNATLRKGSLAR